VAALCLNLTACGRNDPAGAATAAPQPKPAVSAPDILPNVYDAERLDPKNPEAFIQYIEAQRPSGPSTYEQASMGYAALNAELIDPIEESYRIVLAITVGVAHEFSAFG